MLVMYESSSKCIYTCPSVIVRRKRLKGNIRIPERVNSRDHVVPMLGPGYPLSKMLYQYYNANILEMPKASSEAVQAYVDQGLVPPPEKPTHILVNFHVSYEMLHSRRSGARHILRHAVVGRQPYSVGF